jgi:hypothetical protein
MFKYLLLNGVLAVCPVEPLEQPLEVDHVCSLSESERDRLFRECEWATLRSMACLEMADEEIARISSFNGKKACQAALQGAITSLAGASSKERVVIGVITVLGRYLDDAVDGLYNAYYLSMDARTYALKADETQERLWLDE